MNFETLHMVGLTTEQAEAVISALNSHIRRMERDNKHAARRVSELAEQGQAKRAALIQEGLQERIKRIQKAVKIREIIFMSMEGE